MRPPLTASRVRRVTPGGEVEASVFPEDGLIAATSLARALGCPKMTTHYGELQWLADYTSRLGRLVPDHARQALLVVLEHEWMARQPAALIGREGGDAQPPVAATLSGQETE